MCDPTGISATAMLAISIGTAVSAAASSVMGIYAAIQQSRAEAAAYNYQSQVAQTNAKIARQNAQTERQAGIEEARRQRMKTLQIIGDQQAGLAANGVEVGYGTSLDIIQGTAEMGELDALMIETEAERKAQNYGVQAWNFGNEAALDQFRAKNAKTQGTLGAISQGFGGLAKAGQAFSDAYGALKGKMGVAEGQATGFEPSLTFGK